MESPLLFCVRRYTRLFLLKAILHVEQRMQQRKIRQQQEQQQQQLASDGFAPATQPPTAGTASAPSLGRSTQPAAHISTGGAVSTGGPAGAGAPQGQAGKAEAGAEGGPPEGVATPAGLVPPRVGGGPVSMELDEEAEDAGEEAEEGVEAGAGGAGAGSARNLPVSERCSTSSD